MVKIGLVDELLFRELKHGSQFASLFPTSRFEDPVVGNGDTNFSIEKMIEVILQNKNQTTKVAKILNKSSLQDTCASIHDFCYSHFQYKADVTDQLLRTPARAWHERYNGIDCKSYSIMASCILLNLGINHYIRKVAYLTPGEYTHVYVVVPINQKTNNLNDGYFMIDGTLKTMHEQNYIDNKDFLIEKNMKHIVLNSPNYPANQVQLNGTIDDIKNFSSNILGNIKNVFSNIQCIGGSWYNKSQKEATENAIISFLANKIAEINNDVALQNWPKLATDVQDLIGTIASADANFSIKKGEGWNPCTTANLNKTDEFLSYLSAQVIGVTLAAWLDTYFYATPTPTVKTYNCNDFDYNLGFVGCFVGNPSIISLPLVQFNPKPVSIKAFEVNNYTQAMQQGTAFSLDGFINSLSTVVLTYQAVTGNFPGQNLPTGGEYTIDPTTGEMMQPTTQTAGFSTLIGWLIVAGGLGYAFLSSPSTGTGAKSKTTTNAA